VGISPTAFLCVLCPCSSAAWVSAEDERKVSAMLILDTELENRGEFPTVGQLLQIWAARLWAWLRRQPQPEIARDRAHEEWKNGQDCGTGLIL